MFLDAGRWAASLGLAIIVVGACGPPPQPARLGLRLLPAALGASLNLQQHLTVEQGGHVVDLDIALEVDEHEVNIIGLVLGRRVLTLHYDGQTIDMWRDPMVPPQLRGEDVLEDIQLTLWPVESIREVLPNGWRIEENGRHRILFLNGEVVTLIYYNGEPRWSGEVVLRNVRYQYKLTITTALQHASQ
jgi:Protein of unknown function (DUF3261)